MTTPKKICINGEWFDTEGDCEIREVIRSFKPMQTISMVVEIPASCVDLSGTNTVEEAARAVMEQIEIRAFRREPR